MASEWEYTVYGEISNKFQSDRLENLCLPKEGVQTGPFGSQLHKKDYVDIGTPIITVEHLGENRIIHNNLPKVSNADKERLSKYHLKAGDIVFSRVGSVDRRAIVRETENGWLFSGRCLRVRPNPSKLDSYYLSYFLGLRGFKYYINQIAVGATMPSINTKILSDIPIYYPPLEEQRAIAHILGSLDDKIEANRRMNETLENTARAIFKSWFVDFDPVHAKANGETPEGMSAETADLFPDEFQESELGLIPREWGVGILKDLCSKVENGGTPRRSEETYWKPETIKWLTSGEVRQKIIIDTANSISENGYKNSSAKLWHFGTTVVALYGATAGQVTLLATSTTANQACCGLTPLPHTRYFLQIHTSNSTKALESQASGSAQQNLSKGVVESFPTIIPSEEILNIFENKVSVMFEKMILNLQENKTLAELRDTLLPRLISGELRVEDVSEFVGDV